MSVAIEIFVGFKSSVFEDFHKEMEISLGIIFQFISDEKSRSRTHHYYVFSDEYRRITLIEIKDREGFENDGDMNFGDYQYYVSVQAIGWKYPEEHDRILNESSRSIFEKLKATGRYPLMMTYDVQRKLDEFQPKPSETVNN
jgi:hypothetical protein